MVRNQHRYFLITICLLCISVCMFTSCNNQKENPDSSSQNVSVTRNMVSEVSDNMTPQTPSAPALQPEPSHPSAFVQTDRGRVRKLAGQISLHRQVRSGGPAPWRTVHTGKPWLHFGHPKDTPLPLGTVPNVCGRSGDNLEVVAKALDEERTPNGNSELQNRRMLDPPVGGRLCRKRQTQ